MKKKSLNTILLIFVMIFIVTELFSQVEYFSLKDKSALSAGTVLDIGDSDSSVSNEEEFVDREFEVILEYTRFSQTDIMEMTPWSYEVIYKVMYSYDTTQFFTDTLSIYYNDSLQLMSRSNFYATDKSAFLVRVIEVCGRIDGGACVSNPESYPLIPGDIRLKLRLSRNTFEQLSPSTSVSNMFIGTIDDPRLGCPSGNYFTWNFFTKKFVRYELEWVYIDDEVYYVNGSTAGYFNSIADSSMYSIAFTLAEPIRVETIENKYPIPQGYPNGKLYYRVRIVSALVLGPLAQEGQVILGNWTNVQSVNAQFDTTRNYQVVASFAEEGKHKRVVSYYDGMNRNRQSLTYLSTDRVTIIQENVFDHEGRPVIQILPYPEPCIDLAYRNNIHLDSLGGVWDYRDFEIDSVSWGDYLSDAAGSAEYYSPNSPFYGSSSMSYLVPRSFGYPYSRVTFKQDNTGRVDRQSGVGNQHYIGSGHETRNFYGQANMIELTRLFGSNVGLAKHYKKNLVVDGNGQVSVSYQDQEGRVIATALSGQAPPNLMEIPKPAASSVLVNLNEFNQVDSANFKKVISYAVLNTTPNTNYYIEYDLTKADSLVDACGTCSFKLQLQVLNPNGEKIYEVLDSIKADSGCVQGSHYIRDTNLVFTEIGEYRIEKTLRWDADAALSSIKDNLMQDTALVNSYLNQMSQYYFSLMDTNDCDIFNPNPATHPTFTDSSVALAIRNVIFNECAGLRTQMLTQMLPNSGIYLDSALTQRILNNHTFDSTLFTGNGVNVKQFIDTIQPGAAGRLLDYLRNNWQDSFDSTIVRYHPEYCHYNFCLQTRNSALFDYDMIGEKYMSQQLSNGYINPLTISNTLPYQPVTSPLQDPFNFDVATFNDSLQNYELGYTLWEYASPIYQPYLYPTGGNTALSPADSAQWMLFRGGYMFTKQMHLQSYKIQNGCPYLNSSDAVVKYVHRDTDSLVAQVMPYANLYNGTDSLVCTVKCTSKADWYITTLLDGCMDYETLLNDTFVLSYIQDLKASFIQHCVNQCDSLNPMVYLTDEDLAGFTSPTHPLYTTYLKALALDSALLANGYTGCELDTNFYSLSDGSRDSLYSWSVYTYCRPVSCAEDLPTLVNLIQTRLKQSIRTYTHTGQQTIFFADSLGIGCERCTTFPQSFVGLDTTAISDSIFYVSSSYLLLENCNKPGCSPPIVYESDPDSIGVFTYGGAQYTVVDNPYPGMNQTSNCNITLYLEGAVGASLYPWSNVLSLDSLVQGSEQYLSYKQYEVMAYATLDTGTPVSMDGDTTGVLGIIKLHVDLRGCCSDSICTIDSIQTVNINTIVLNTDSIEQACIQNKKDIAWSMAQNSLDEYLDSLALVQFNQAKEICLGRPEDLWFDYALDEYHYTLYYYDQAGNLVQTVPPKGVDVLSMSHFPGGIWDSVEPNHTFKTRYQYTSINKPFEQQTPDGGLSLFYYDDKGRLRDSKNEKQALNGIVSTVGDTVFTTLVHSHTDYDVLGRITQVCEQTSQFKSHQSVSGDPLWDETGFLRTSTVNKQITKTYYDAGSNVLAANFTPQFLRNRVSKVTYQEYAGSNYDAGTYYSYDVHGNVKTLVQEYAALYHFVNQKYKRIDYDYDLISGKVNDVHYQVGKNDMYEYAYTYDADNRIIKANSWNTNPQFDTDARYYYYLHGPLGRMEIGEEFVQGVDYAYTIHGWLKGVNGDRLNASSDIGKDGAPMNLFGNGYVARDAYGFVLDYYNGDYTASSSVTLSSLSSSDPYYNSHYAAPGAPTQSGLYNGNISRMHVALCSPKFDRMPVVGNAYTYDQLNRIMASTVYFNATLASTGSWSGITASQKYKTSYSYDANGNLLTLMRKDQDGVLMDDFVYNYGSQNNQLDYVNDLVVNTPYEGDMESGQTPGNYQYDAIGNLTQDDREGIDSIIWNAYGKVTRVVHKAGVELPDLEFAYDAMGQRILKVSKPRPGGTLSSASKWVYTLYVRDAQGNVLAIYDVKQDTSTSDWVMHWSEQHLYGSSRLGIYKPDREMARRSCGGPIWQYSRPDIALQQCVTPSVNNALDPNDLVEGDPFVENLVHIPIHKAFRYGAVSGTKHLGLASIDKWNFINSLKGKKMYELTDHLGNVLVTIKDKKLGIDTDNNGSANYYEPWVRTVTDYYPFGMPLPLRNADDLNKCKQQVDTTLVPVYLSNWNTGPDGWMDGYGQPADTSQGNMIVLNSGGLYVRPLFGVSGKTYRVTYQVAMDSCDGPFTVGLANDAFDNFNFVTAFSSGVYSFTYIAQNDSLFIAAINDEGDCTPQLLSVSVQEETIRSYQVCCVNKTVMDTSWVALIEEEFDTPPTSNWVGITTGLPVDSVSGGYLIINADSLLGISLTGLVPANTTIRYEYGFTVDSLCVDTVVVGVFDSVSTLQMKVFVGAANDSGLVTIPTTQNVSFAIAIPAQNCEIRLDYFRAYAMLIQPVTVCDTVRFVDLKDGYPYGFNGQAKDDEVYGNDNAYSFTYRVYDTRIGRFLSVDPLTKYYPYYTPYQFAGNKPIHSVDVDGLEDAKFDAFERNDWRAARQLYPNDIDKQFEYVHNNQKYRGYGALFGVGILATIYTGGRAAPILQRLAVSFGAFATSPQGQQTVTEVASFLANLFYEGPEDVMPTPGPGGELGKALRSTSSYFKKSLVNLLGKSFETNIDKTIVSKVKGSFDDAYDAFQKLAEGSKIETVKNKTGNEINIAKLEDGTTLTLRKFSSSENSANAVIEINSKNVSSKEKGRSIEIKFFE